MAEDYAVVKRLKCDTTIIYPNFVQKTSKTELYKETSISIAQSITGPPAQQQPVEIPLPIDDLEASNHQRRTLQDTLSWENCQEELLAAHYDCMVPSVSETCTQCSKDIVVENHIRCKDCSGQCFFCSYECLSVSHNGKQLPFHKPQIWKVII